MKGKGKAAGSQGVFPGGDPGQRPAHLTARFLRGIKHFFRHVSRLRQHEIRKILEDPVILQRSIDDPQKFPRQGDDRLSCPAPRLHLS